MRSREEIKAYAKDKGVKLVDVAGVIGVSRQRLANIMRESMNGMWEKKIIGAIDAVYADTEGLVCPKCGYTFGEDGTAEGVEID